MTKIKEKWKKLDFEYKLLIICLPILLIISVYFTLKDEGVAEYFNIVVNKEWTGYWGNITGGIIGGLITLLTVRMALNHASDMHKNTMKKIEIQRMEDDEKQLDIKRDYVRSVSQIIEHVYEFLYLEPNRWIGFINSITRHIDRQVDEEIEPEEFEALIDFMQAQRTHLILQLRERLDSVESHAPNWSKVCRQYSTEAVRRLEDLYESLFNRFESGEMFTYKDLYEEFREEASYIHNEIYEKKFKIIFEQGLSLDLTNYHVSS